jgi:hypothetical protein
MEARQNIETMSDLELGLLLESLYQQAFQVNQNIQLVSNRMRSKLPPVKIETAPEQPTTE